MDLCGGWAESAPAHDSMLHPVPDAIEERGASLDEPVAIACHGLMRAARRRRTRLDRRRRHHRSGVPRRATRPLSAPSGHARARHRHQGEAAVACGADHVAYTEPDNGHWEELASLSGSRVVGRKRHQMLMGGFSYVIEAVGSPGPVTEALRAVADRAASPRSARPGSARWTSRRSRRRKRRWSAPSTTPSMRTRRPGWRAPPTGTGWTGRSTCSLRACCHMRWS